ncbi:MAG: TAXI family TRAP transporter solute-binding subunit [Pseudorhodoplanes sp.]
MACAAMAVAASYFYLQPSTLKVAVPQAYTADARILGAVADLLRSQRASVRLQVVNVETSQDALDALTKRTADLAILRSDLAASGRAQTVLIMRTEAGVFVIPKGGKVKDIADAAKGRIGVIRDVPTDGALLPLIFDYYNIPRPTMNVSIMAVEGVAAALRERKIDALVAVGPVASKSMADVIAEAAKGSKAGIEFINFEEASAIAKRFPALEEIEVEQGAFGGRPARPAEAFNTLGYTVRLVGHEKTDSEAVAELVKQIVNNRNTLSQTVPFAGLIQTPDLDSVGPFIVHAGARTYINGEQKNFFDRYSDYVYLGLFLGSAVGSLLTGAYSWVHVRRRRNVMAPVVRLREALDDLPQATTLADIDKVEQQARDVFRSALDEAVDGEHDAATIATFELAMSEARARIAERRTAIAQR